jgi:hypothetical protein
VTVIAFETSAIRVDLQTKLKRAVASVSDIVKGQETLDDHHKYAVFVEIMMPDDVEDSSQFFDVPQKTIDCREKLMREIFS